MVLVIAPLQRAARDRARFRNEGVAEPWFRQKRFVKFERSGEGSQMLVQMEMQGNGILGRRIKKNSQLGSSTEYGVWQ